MRVEDYELLYELEEKYWWFVGMRRITDAILQAELAKPACILDAGCGTGFNLHHYQSPTRKIFALDVASEAIDGVRKRGAAKVVQASVTDIPYRTETFDLVFSFDILQQLPAAGQEQGISEMHRVLKSGGSLFIRVAAFQWLYSSHDRDLHTVHRFSRSELVAKLIQGGFKVEWSSYANSLLFPVVALRRLLKHVGIGKGTDVKPLPSGLKWIDPIFLKMLSKEAEVFKTGRSLCAGLSIVARARKE